MTLVCYGYSLEVPHQGNSVEYPQHNLFSWRNKKKTNNFFVVKTALSGVM